ncbi:MAG: HAMP domain-containing histidine kinase [Planctomycetota bacterium]|nr:HAMP domain-containing histidine kinase [Planctomycetota bacterium]
MSGEDETGIGDIPSARGPTGILGRQRMNPMLADPVTAMRHFVNFQRQALALKKSTSIDNAFDAMETLIIKVVDFSYVSLQYRDAEGNFSPLRQICPASLPIDVSLMQWVMNSQEVSAVPVEYSLDGEYLRSLIALPFGRHHLMLLWREQDTDALTQEQEVLLSILSREMAAVLDTHHYRLRLEKAHAAMADIVASIPIGLLSLDHNNVVQMINPPAENTLRLGRDRVIGIDYHFCLPSELAELIDKLSGGDGAEEAELVLPAPAGNGPDGGGAEPRREGQIIGVSVSPMCNDESGGQNGRIVICRDLRLSREVKKLRELDAMKDDFLSLITHELRTPLTSIMAYSETLMLDESQGVPGDWREYIGIINSEGKRLCQLIDNALDLTRMRGEKMRFEFTRQDPNELIGAVIMSFSHAMEEKGLELEMDLADDIGECSLIEDRFAQVVTNLVSNAVKFTAPGGKITIATRKADPLPGSAVPSLLLSVRDSGCGISPENMNRIFADFEILEKVKHHTAGTGLSLAICRQIIENGHHGKIWLESEPDRGSVFYVQVPLE